MRGLASFCLFGDDVNGIYRLGALKNAEMYATLYQGTLDVVSRFYVSTQTVEWATENLLRIPGVEVVPVDGPEDFTATFWRYRALEDKDYDFWLFRDTDSRPILRERVAVAEWLDSDKTYHIMRDHPYHNVPIMAGLWGVKNVAKTASLHKLFRFKRMKSYYQVDQRYLHVTVWRTAKYDCLAHVDCAHTFGTKTQPFTVPISDEGFCGEGFYGDGSPRFPQHARNLVG